MGVPAVARNHADLAGFVGGIDGETKIGIPSVWKAANASSTRFER